jgi:hypothetical protein
LSAQNKGLGKKKPYSSVSFPTTNLTWNDLVSNPDLRVERPAINRLCYDTVLKGSLKQV